MENFSFLDSENCAVKDKLIGEKIKGVGTVARKKLTDISNLQQQPKPLSVQTQPNPFSAKDHIQKLLAENAAQRKIINDKNKIIELSGKELQKLQINLERVQQQNMQLAQANTNMLVELNSGKDRLKSLTHELGCRNGLIEALKLDSQAKARTGTSTCQECEEKICFKFETLKCEKAAASFPAEKIDGKPCKTTKRLQSVNQSTLLTCKQDQAKEKTETKRRRQSARFKAEDPKPNEDSFQIEDTPLPMCPSDIDSLCESGPTYSNSEVRDEAKVEDDSGSSGVQQSQRLSVGRPQRRAAEKIQSYKEIPINVKMRREASYMQQK